MNLQTFQKERETRWGELAALTRRAGGKAARLGPGDARRLGQHYRATAADLAFARQRLADDALVHRLELLVGAARPLVYAGVDRRGALPRLGTFLASGYWRLIAERPRPVVFSWLLLLVPSLIVLVWALRDPVAAGALQPGLQSVAEPGHQGLQLDGIDQNAGVALQIMWNNIQVTFLCFAGGIALGLVTTWVLVSNGVLLGAVAGLATSGGNGRDVVRLIVAHGVLELSCIAVSGAAGLRLGWALIEPGARTRRDALVDEARATVQIALGTAPWLIVAGLVEGFVTGAASLGVAAGVGVVLGAIYWLLVVTRGRAPSPAGTP